ncbi:MAG: FAD-binding oxidoreductase [Hyphomicrobiales bacterium]
MHNRYHSWGRYPQFDQSGIRLHWRSQPLPIQEQASISYLPFGNGRSYGDSCLNEGGLLLDARGLDRFIAFDSDKGFLRCESGVLLADILAFSVPRGWFLPVVPGTKFVTVGGAVANDIHGKNHHSAGTFGCYVRCLELLRSNGQRLLCSPSENAEWFRATIGGLGLTGLILWAEIELKRIHNATMEVETVRFSGLDDFFDLCAESDPLYEYTVAWIDCMAQGLHVGRGIFLRGKHAGPNAVSVDPPRRRIGIPVVLPFPLITRLTAHGFNQIHYRMQSRTRSSGFEHYERFFFPLDGIRHWNRLYGHRGFLQYQCVIPLVENRTPLREILNRIVHRSVDAYLGVLKIFGNRRSPGLLSFPRSGVTIALDFHHHGRHTLQLLEDLDEIVLSAGGAVNPYKDARMSEASFKRYYPRWQELEGFRDPKFSSSFWRRVTGG